MRFFAPLLLALFCLHAARAEPTHDRALHEAVRVAKNMMASQDIYSRILAAGALSDIGDRQALDILERCLTVDDTVILRSAIDTLITANHPSSVDLLFKTASRNSEVLGLMAESLASVPRDDMGELLAKALHEQNDFVKKHALQALVRAPAAGETAEVQKVADAPGTSPVIKAYAAYALFAAGRKEMASEFFKAARSSSTDIREVAAVGLGMVDTQASRDMLKELGKESDKRVAVAAVASSAGLGDDEAVGKVIQTIAYGQPMEATVMAGAMKRLPPQLAQQITETLLTCCRLKGDAATRLLESWGFISANPAKIYAWGLGHADPDVRMQTVWVIGQRRDAGAIPLLEPFLEDKDEGIRGMAAWSIIHIEGANYVEGVET